MVAEHGRAFERSIFACVMARIVKAVRAEYDASLNALRLAEPLDGVTDHEQVTVTVELPLPADPSWTKLAGSLSKEAGEELARAVEEMFPVEK